MASSAGSLRLEEAPRTAKISLTLDGKERSLKLPPECLSVAQAASHAKRQLGAGWADACMASSWPPALSRFDGHALCNLTNVMASGKGGRPVRKRLFLSAKGWQPGMAVSAEAGLLAFSARHSFEGPAADELPASLLRRGLLRLQAFTAKHAQVTIDLPDGRTVKLPVTEATCGADVASHAAQLLGCTADSVLLWAAGGSNLVSASEKVIPGKQYRAKLSSAPGPATLAILVRMLSGSDVTVHLAPDSTVDDMKRAVTERTRIGVDQQRLTFRGKYLENGRTLADYCIGDGATVHLVLNLCGGMFARSSGRAGDFQELTLPVRDEEADAITASGRTPVEVVLPDGSSVLLACTEQDGPDQVLAALRERLGAAAAEAAVLSADVDSVQDVGALRGMLAQAQAALRRRQP